MNPGQVELSVKGVLKRTPAEVVDGRVIMIEGRILRIASVHDQEWLEGDAIGDPEALISRLRSFGVKADLFTFVQGISDLGRSLEFHREPDPIAVLEIESYEKWFQNRINDKTRNMIRKAPKKGVSIQVVDFSDDLVRGIQGIQNESPIRQGRRFWHYGKDFETTKKAHATYLERSEFIGAFFEGSLIGYIKLVHKGDSTGIMQITSMMAHRDKAPTNALLAKAVEICAGKGIRFLSYGEWSAKSLGDFKMRHGFVRWDLQRYFVPLNLRGRLALKLKIKRKWTDCVPEKLRERLIDARARWYAARYSSGRG